MIIIQAEDGAIVTDTKEIYIDKDLDGHLHIYADLSSTDRVKAVQLTVDDYSKKILDDILENLYKYMNRLFRNGHRHCSVRIMECIYGQAL